MRTISIVDCHCSGEVGNVIVGGILDVPSNIPTATSTMTMYDKLIHFRTHSDHIRQLLLNEPRGRPAMNTNLVLPPCDPSADAGLLIMESEEYPPMSGGNAICTATVLLETGMVEMHEPITKVRLDTPAGLVDVTAQCQDGKCVSVEFENVPSFVFRLDLKVYVPELEREVSVDVAYGGMIYAIVDVRSLGMKISNDFPTGSKLIAIGEMIKKAVQDTYTPVHPSNPDIKGVSILEFTEPLVDGVAVNAVVVSPGRFDRCPCGTGSCARMAVLHARGQLAVGERFQHESIIGSQFECHIRGTTKVGEYDAVLPAVKGSAWITGYRQMVLDKSDPFPRGFRVGDQWK